MDPFTQLVLLAHGEQWCWKIICTTCGHMHFRYGFIDLVNGRRPDGPDWRIRHDVTDYANWIDYDPPPGRPFKPDAQLALLRLARELDLDLLLARCEASFVLGSIGLVLFHCEPMERLRRILTPRLIDKLEPHLRAREGRVQKVKELFHEKPMHWSDLELIEELLSR